MSGNDGDGATSSGGTDGNKFSEIYELLEKLCKYFVGPTGNYKDILVNVTRYLSSCPTAMLSTLPYDESTLVAKVTQHLNNSSTRMLALPNTASTSGVSSFTSAPSSVGGNIGGVTNDAVTGLSESSVLFLKLYEELTASQIDQHKRGALLTFLYLMADSKYENGYRNIGGSSTNSGHTTSTTQTAISSITNRQLVQKTHPVSAPGSHVSAHYSRKVIRPNSLLPHSSNDGYRRHLKVRNEITDEQKTNVETSAFHREMEANNILDNDIVQNVIYVFTGIQGKYLKKDIISGKFKLDPKVKSVNPVQAGMLLRLSELGYYHDLVQSYTNITSGLCPLGLMGQGFVSALKNELTMYYGLVATLQEQFNKQRKVEYNMAVQGKSFVPVRPERLTLLKLMVWSVDSRARLQWLAIIAEACQEKKGGALASTVHSFMNNGNPMVKSIARELLLAVCGPLYQMLTKWLLEGEICDPHGEFFIECLTEVGPDRLWHDKYRVRTAMLPKFIPSDMAHKILVTGKSINFLCEVCEDKGPVKGRNELHRCIEENGDQIFSRAADTKLHSTIDSIYLNTSKRVLDIIMGPHKLLEHMQAMRRYLLLGQGDFIGILLESLKCELDKPAKELYSYDLSSIMDAAVRATNAQYDDPEILNHLDVRLMTPCDGDIGWDILSLQYTVRGPLATMLEPSMGVYQILFKPLWRMKHMEFVLSSKIWKDQKCNAKRLRCMGSEFPGLFYRLHLLTSEMIHFINQMQYYILFEVIECAWAEFQQRVQQAKTLDDILNAHDDFLNAIKFGAFLDSNSGELCQNMESVYDGIIRLEVWQDKFYGICFTELAARKQYETNIINSETTGKFGVTTEQQLERDQGKKIFEQTIASYHKSLENICADYEKAVRCFLLTLNSNNDHNLQLFGIRLDFNEYYKKRDQRLCVPLTFEHMRMSILNNGNKSLSGSRYSTVN